MSNSRNILFDYAKGIGIILVVYGHVMRGLLKAGLPMDRELHGLIDSIIYSFHMPLFFFLSGVFFFGSMDRHGELKLIENKFKTVLYPYVIWSLIQGLIEVGFSHSTNYKTSLWQVLSLWHPRAQFWFLYTLFIVFIASIAIYRRRNAYWSFAVLALAVLLNVSRFSPTDVYAVYSFSQWFVYFALGVGISSLPSRNYRLQSRTGLILFLSVAAFAASQAAFHSSLGLSAYGNAPASHLALAFVGIAFVMALCRFLMRYDLGWLKYLGRHSMEIYLIHIIGSSGIRIVLQNLLGISDVSLHFAFGMLFGIGIPLLVVALTPRLGLEWLFLPPPKLLAGLRRSLNSNTN